MSEEWICVVCGEPAKGIERSDYVRMGFCDNHVPPKPDEVFSLRAQVAVLEEAMQGPVWDALVVAARATPAPPLKEYDYGEQIQKAIRAINAVLPKSSPLGRRGEGWMDGKLNRKS